MRKHAVAVALAAVAISVAGPASAEGFGTHDLTTIEAEVAAAFGPDFYHWAIPGSMSLSCCDSREDQIISIDIDRQTDELGQQDRTDEAYIAELEDICTNQGIPCQIEEIDVGEAIGRLLTMSLGSDMEGVNAFVVRDGDRLTIRSAAADAKLARENVETALEALRRPLLEN